MSRDILELLKRSVAPKCATCKGSGLAQVTGAYWLPEVCICSACSGTGSAPQPQGQSK